MIVNSQTGETFAAMRPKIFDFLSKTIYIVKTF